MSQKGDLKWVEGSFPTLYGTITVKRKDGMIETSYDAPTEIEIIN